MKKADAIGRPLLWGSRFVLGVMGAEVIAAVYELFRCNYLAWNLHMVSASAMLCGAFTLDVARRVLRVEAEFRGLEKHAAEVSIAATEAALHAFQRLERLEAHAGLETQEKDA